MLMKPEKEKEKEKSRVNFKERVEDNICDLSLSGLNEVPVRGIATYKRVTILDLSSNNISTLGRNFCSMLTRLVHLNLSRNQLRNLPEDFGTLHNLRHLDLYDNKLEYLPLSFGDLVNLRYLDLKGNPLAAAFVKVVGPNMTTKDCQDSARNTVTFMASMQSESKRYIKDLGEFVYGAKDAEISDYGWEDEAITSMESNDVAENTDLEKQLEKILVIPIPRNKKRNRNKNKKKAQGQLAASVTKDKLPDTLTTTTKLNVSNKQQNAQLRNNETAQNTTHMATRKIQRGRKKHGWCQYIQRRFIKRYISNTVLRSILTFFILLAINIFVIYMIMFKNPELAEKIVEAIPQQYRDWIIDKTEIFRVNIGDWIADFLTPPDEQ